MALAIVDEALNKQFGKSAGSRFCRLEDADRFWWEVPLTGGLVTTQSATTQSATAQEVAEFLRLHAKHLGKL